MTISARASSRCPFSTARCNTDSTSAPMSSGAANEALSIISANRQAEGRPKEILDRDGRIDNVSAHSVSISRRERSFASSVAAATPRSVLGR